MDDNGDYRFKQTLCGTCLRAYAIEGVACCWTTRAKVPNGAKYIAVKNKRWGELLTMIECPLYAKQLCAPKQKQRRFDQYDKTEIDAYKNLANEIVLRACKDYDTQQKDVEIFLKSKYFIELCRLDGVALLEGLQRQKLKKEVIERERRRNYKNSISRYGGGEK